MIKATDLILVLAATALCAGTGIVTGTGAGVNARRLLDDSNGQGNGEGNGDDATCITTSTPKDFVRLWGIELGSDAAYNATELKGLPCDDSWESYNATSAPYLEHNVWASAPAVLKEVMSSLKLSTGDPDSEVFRCGKEGVKWYTVNDFRGCALKDGKTFEYRGKSYTNTDDTHVDSLAATISYVCNGQARRRDVGVTYTAVAETKCI